MTASSGPEVSELGGATRGSGTSRVDLSVHRRGDTRRALGGESVQASEHPSGGRAAHVPVRPPEASDRPELALRPARVLHSDPSGGDLVLVDQSAKEVPSADGPKPR